MSFKVIIHLDPGTGQTDNFLWTDKEEPPPLVRPRILRGEAPKEDKMIKSKLCFYFRYNSYGEGFYQIHRIELSPKNTILPTVLFGINDGDKLPFEDFANAYKERRIEGKFKVIVDDQDYLIDPIAYYAHQTKAAEPGAITQFRMPLCIDITIKPTV